MPILRMSLVALAACAAIGSSSQAAPVPPYESIKSDVTTAAARKTFLDDLKTKTIEANLALPLNSENESKWESAFWGMELSLYREDLALRSLRQALSDSSKRSDSFTRSALEAAHTLFPTQLDNEVRSIARQTKNAKNFAMAAQYLVKSHPERAKGLLDLLRHNFSDPESNPILNQLKLRLEIPFAQRVKSRPPLADLLAQKFPADAPVIFTLQRCNRDYPGLVIIRKPDGSFVRRADGSMFAVGQLARAMSNCPGYLTNGNTPQGVFSVQNIGHSSNTFIGPTPALWVVLPFEESVDGYFHDKARASEKWSRDLYKGLLPKSWQDYVPIYEAYAAGEAGRGSILVHGTTIYPEFYKGQTYYPNTPSMGCLCALELWSPEDGHCTYSDQHAIVDAYSSMPTQAGYLVVVDLDDEHRPVSLPDVLPAVMEAEKR